MMGGCKKCCKATGWLVLIAGILFLLVDLNFWNFWNVQWWTALFVILGVTCIAKSNCKDCNAAGKR